MTWQEAFERRPEGVPWMSTLKDWNDLALELGASVFAVDSTLECTTLRVFGPDSAVEQLRLALGTLAPRGVVLDVRGS